MLHTNYPGSPKESEQFIQSALDALSAHIAILDTDGTIITVNTAWRRFADMNELCDPKYGVGTNYLNTCGTSNGRNSREASMVSRGIREVMEGRRQEYILEYPCHSPQEQRWFMLHVSRFIWDGNYRVIIAHQNVTELKRVQIQLDDSNKHLEAILDHVANGIVTISANGRLKSMNPAARAIFGYNDTESYDVRFTHLFAPSERDLPQRKLIDILLKTPDQERIGQRADGTTFPMTFGLTEVFLGNRRIFTGIVQDITERKRMEAELLEKERISVALEKERELREFKNRFIGMMSHELRTPLSSIMLSSDLLKVYGDKVPPDEKDMYLDNINTQVEHLTALVKDMLAVSRSEVSELDFLPNEIDVMGLCRQIFEEFQVAYQNTHTVSFSSEPEQLIALVDSKLMRQLITNLLSNALKYSPHGTPVNMKAKLNGRMIIIEVQDSGIGIPESDMPMLFQPFHRAANADNVPGTGLGLTIVKQAVDMHRGTIDVHSEENNGTRFTVKLPLMKNTNAAD